MQRLLTSLYSSAKPVNTGKPFNGQSHRLAKPLGRLSDRLNQGHTPADFNPTWLCSKKCRLLFNHSNRTEVTPRWSDCSRTCSRALMLGRMFMPKGCTEHAVCSTLSPTGLSPNGSTFAYGSRTTTSGLTPPGSSVGPNAVTSPVRRFRRIASTRRWLHLLSLGNAFTRHRIAPDGKVAGEFGAAEMDLQMGSAEIQASL